MTDCDFRFSRGNCCSWRSRQVQSFSRKKSMIYLFFLISTAWRYKGSGLGNNVFCRHFRIQLCWSLVRIVHLPLEEVVAGLCVPYSEGEEVPTLWQTSTRPEKAHLSPLWTLMKHEIFFPISLSHTRDLTLLCNVGIDLPGMEWWSRYMPGSPLCQVMQELTQQMQWSVRQYIDLQPFLFAALQHGLYDQTEHPESCDPAGRQDRQQSACDQENNDHSQLAFPGS